MAVRAAALCLLLVHQASPALAQAAQPVTLVVSENGKEIGREEFTLTQGRGRGAPGTTLTATAKYPATVSTTRLTALLERTPESAIAKFQLDVEGPDGTTVILAAGSGANANANAGTANAGPSTEQAIIDACRAELAAFKVPKRVVAVAELPRNAMGKVQKNRLREQLAQLFGSEP